MAIHFTEDSMLDAGAGSEHSRSISTPQIFSFVKDQDV
jgi:hypothetical protein